ncbi:MAG: nitroreductase family deazaflavin-dependent oxidoreductase [Acidimicrobiia bacterium]|nr:nitroreductase family deazaflavin-dependent oxidoreductase [Acidimicrobiia bacterium]MDH3398884.1 nitroreductase family deazaflavin-dependent oxidoreductase [Acidimicrobiia bacterium]
MADSTAKVPSGKVPAPLNAMMTFFLKTPVLQNSIGKYVALLTFTGRRSGRKYSIPISYRRRNNSILMWTTKDRSWWRNFEDQPAVEVRLAGRIVTGRAEAHVGTDSDLEEVVDFLTGRTREAKAHGVAMGPDGSPDPADVRALLPLIVLVHIDLT